MAEFFFLKCGKSNGDQLYLHVPNSIKTQEEVQLVAHTKCQEKNENNQLWSYDGARITSFLSPSYRICVREIVLGREVVLRRDNEDEVQLFDAWLFDEGVIKLEENHSFCIGLASDGKSIELQNTQDIMPVIEDPIMQNARNILAEIERDLPLKREGMVLKTQEELQSNWKKLMEDTDDILKKTDDILQNSDSILQEANNLVQQNKKAYLPTKSAEIPSFLFPQRRDELMPRSPRDTGAMKWRVEMMLPRSRCAVTSQLNYSPRINLDDSVTSWTAENTIRVNRNDAKTFFCAIGWGGGLVPSVESGAECEGNMRGGGGGGHCGVEQDSEGNCILEFRLIPYYRTEDELRGTRRSCIAAKNVKCLDSKDISFRVQGKRIDGTQKGDRDHEDSNNNSSKSSNSCDNNNNNINVSNNTSIDKNINEDNDNNNNNNNNNNNSENSNNNINYNNVNNSSDVSNIGNDSKNMKENNIDNRCSSISIGLVDDADGESKVHWECSCWYSFDGEKWFALGSFKIYHDTIPFDGRLYSFIEDREWSTSTVGHSLLRLCEFSSMKVNVRSGEVQEETNHDGDSSKGLPEEGKAPAPKRSVDGEMTIIDTGEDQRGDNREGADDEVEYFQAVFSKQVDCTDSNRLDKSFCGLKSSSRSFVLSTGGSTLTSINRYLFLEKYESCTNKSFTMLTLPQC